MSRKSPILAGLLYRLRKKPPEATPGFRFAVPAEDWPKQAWAGDCWIINRKGRVDPGLSASPIPIRREDIGRMVGRVPGTMER